MTEKTTADVTHDPLDRLMNLVAEVHTHRERMQKLFEQLDTSNAAQCLSVLMQEMTDTQMSLLEEFADAASDTFDFDRLYIEQEIVPLLPDDEDDDEDDEDEDDGSILTKEDAVEYLALFGGYRVVLVDALAQKEIDDQTKSELESYLARVDKAIARTDDITEVTDGDEPDVTTLPQ